MTTETKTNTTEAYNKTKINIKTIKAAHFKTITCTTYKLTYRIGTIFVHFFSINLILADIAGLDLNFINIQT